MKRAPKISLLVLVVIFIGIQFSRPPKNAGEEVAASQLSAVQPVPEAVAQILKVSCNDCHSNTTHYPWYNQVQPVAWWLNRHVVEGKKELNFSEFASYPVYRRYKKLKEIQKQVRDDEMPLFSYTLPHRDAVLSADQKASLVAWAASAMKEMEAKYPAESLTKPK